MNKFEELLAKYGKTADEVTFEYENLSDEELEVAFNEAFEEAEEETEIVADEAVVEDAAEETIVVETSEVENEEVAEETADETVDEAAEIVEEPVEEVVESEEQFVLQYELSHDDIRSALYSLLAVESDAEYCYAWILEVFDNKFIYQDYMENKFYRRGYSKDGENVALDESKVEVFNEWLSEAERNALDALKADYTVLKEFKETYDASVIKAQKNEILDKAEYECLADNAEFAQLRVDADKFSIEEISTKADLIFAAHMKSKMEFSAKDEDTKKLDVLGFNFNKKESKKGPYGNLFAKD